ncbi:arsenosugar biosynthesis radical SAM (seleno)protein ArsS [Adhaeribacter aquaticus]|uniref:arsenosugar biosynthesis radical SAM (seleno)protein ArsS n=1 Tax=Adhaeribacter aquaticus TaxID=299567 RepID=UPI0004083E1E|nr:arsenosugar biosynthesis radical SAM (seleno)protein ArsS [Adhaeribacter aquaticus]
MQSLKRKNHELADTLIQLEVLNKATQQGIQFPAFTQKLRDINLFPLKPTQLEIFQVNVGKMCNQVCKHCHVDAGPDRKEIMTRATMQQCLDALALTNVKTVDLTGGAPEMNPDFRWFVEEISKLGREIIVRCNLTIIVANKKYYDLPEFFKAHKVHVISSLPYFSAARTNAQRGDGVFEDSVKALKMLNAVGYGQEGSDLVLDLVYNPSGAFLPASQGGLEKEFKQKLKQGFGIDFNNLFAITNLPISRFLDYLLESKNYDGYMEKLVNAFNPVAATNVMCRNTISVSWDGFMYDCDFNQMLDLKVAKIAPQHISEFNEAALNNRSIVLNQHCYGCTAGAGSSCGGTTT